MRLIAKFVSEFSTKAASLLRMPLHRSVGDMAVSGKGEILIAAKD